MSIGDLSNVFGFLGGLGMFLYGMNLMAEGMQKTAKSRISRFFGMLTNNRVTAVAFGALITAVIQSSGATTVMVVSFVSAGIWDLTQSVGVIMGANIGTTITAWIVSMNQMGKSFAFFDPALYEPCLIGAGAMFLVFSKKQKRKTAGEILIGLGLLFMGLSYMSGSVKPYTNVPAFSKVFSLLGKNPFLGILAGASVTAFLQSSSASVGILQTLAASGMVTMNTAVFITLGQNIGSCVTAMLSATGGSRTAKRAAMIHLSFNVIGAGIFGILSCIAFIVMPQMAGSEITSVQISVFHTVFNLTNTVILFPFADHLVKLSGVLIKDKAAKNSDDEAASTAWKTEKRSRNI